MRAPIYLDYNATAPVDPEVADAIAPFLHEFFGSPGSSHSHGQLAREAVAVARKSVPTLLGPRRQKFCSQARPLKQTT